MSGAERRARGQISFRGVHKTLGGREILRGLDLEVPHGSTYVLMGPSGSGKSVTLKHIVGILRPDRGEVRVGGEDPATTDRTRLAALRRRIGFLFQEGALLNWMTLAENVALPLREVQRLPEAAIRARVAETLERVHLADAATKYPSEISGGMRKRAALARAIATRPEVVLYDEPDAGLDPFTGASINSLIRQLQREMETTAIVVTHSRSCALAVADRIGIFSDGKLLREGTPAEMAASDDPRIRPFLDLDYGISEEIAPDALEAAGADALPADALQVASPLPAGEDQG